MRPIATNCRRPVASSLVPSGRVKAATDSATGLKDAAALGAAKPSARKPAIVLRGVEKSFRVPLHRRGTLKERVLHPFTPMEVEELHAARGVSFTVGEGEFFGIVGRNGSGKSTLLKLLAGIYQPDTGEIRIEGRVSPLIELGVGFNPEMAARDNVLVNGTLLGLSRAETLQRFDEIVEFAGLERFTELPLKNYSAGMLTRLAFSIAINVDADVLLLDEVLAVGDVGFQEKCFETFRRLHKAGKTIVLVTHAMATIRRFCSRAILIEQGRMVKIGDPEDIAELYRETVAREPGAGPEGDPRGARYGDGSAEIEEVWVEDELALRGNSFEQGGWLTICAQVRFEEAMEDPSFVFVIRSEDGRNVFSSATAASDAGGGAFEAGERIMVRLRFRNHLGVGTYEITPCVAHPEGRRWADARKDFSAFAIRGDGWTGAMVDLPNEFAIERKPSP